jgi:3-phytase/alkaline phosphatase D
MRRLSPFAIVALAVVVGACAATRRAPAPAPADEPWLELAGEFNIPPLTPFAPLKAARFGGVSGITFDPTPGPAARDLLGICDDRETSRLFIFRMGGEGATFRVALRAYFPLPSGPDAPTALDAEGIAMDRSGRIYVASEGVQNRDPRVPPSITMYNRRVEYLGRLPVPARFIAAERGEVTHGMRENGGFESLTITPNERHLFTATELPLVQDGPPPSFERGALTRILEYQSEGDSFRPAREFAYPLDAVANADFTPRTSINGIVELLALSPTELLAMERSFAVEPGENGRSVARIRIYRASLAGASDVSPVESLQKGRGVRPVSKTLLLDLADVKGLSRELAALDNFEGMAFGPTLADGSRSLLLVSDDNFSARQRTSFLLFRIRRPL